MKVSQATVVGDQIIASDDPARVLQDRSVFGEKGPKGSVLFSFIEALYLLENEKITISSTRKYYDFDAFYKYCTRKDNRLSYRYAVYKALREKGYVVKTALKFGGDFRVYNKGTKPGQEHAKWVVYAVSEDERLYWQDFCAKNRVAHSTRKKLLLGVVDSEQDVTFFEVNWIRP